MARIEERTPSIVDLAEKVGRHYRSPHLAKDDTDQAPGRRIWLLVVAVVVVLAVAVLVWRVVR